MAFFTPMLTCGMLVKRSRPFTSTSAAMMTTSAASTAPAGKSSDPADPWVSTTIS
jgi:hypothetical protein